MFVGSVEKEVVIRWEMDGESGDVAGWNWWAKNGMWFG